MSVRRYVIIAVLSGLGACISAGLLLFVVARNSSRVAREQGETVTVIVAERDLPVGTRLSRDMLEERLFLRSSAPKGYYDSTDDLVNQTLMNPVYAGQAISRAEIGGEDAANASSQVPPGHVAYALAIDPEMGVGGFIRPGDRVDILSTSDTETVALLQDVIVVGVAGEFPFGLPPTATPEAVSASRAISRPSLSLNVFGEGVNKKIFILDLTPEQARLLADARAKTIVSIALHSSQQSP